MGHRKRSARHKTEQNGAHGKHRAAPHTSRPAAKSPSQSTTATAASSNLAPKTENSTHIHHRHHSHRDRLEAQKSASTVATNATNATNATAASVRSRSSGHSHHTRASRDHRSKRSGHKKTSLRANRIAPKISRNSVLHQKEPQPPAKPITQVIDMHKSKESAAGLGGLLKRVSEMAYKSVVALRHIHRKKPEHFRHQARSAQSPSDLSFRSITEHYTLPEGELQKSDDVFKMRGFKKLNKIDEGAFGVVSRALSLVDKSIVAVKEVDLRRKRSKRIEEMKRELFVLQKVEHANVVKLIEHFTIDHTLVIIMEFCAGGNLTSYLKETAISEEEAARLFRQMALALKVLHRKGIAHRDVKLNNFLMDGPRKHIKIADFGLSIVYFRESGGIRMAKTYCGTEPYMAPELLRRNSLGARSYNALYADVWSLGICLFAMLTRTFPFKMQTSQRGLLRAQLARRWRFPRKLRDTLSEEIKDLVAHMLDPEPDRRISINGVLAHPWINHNQLVALSYDES